MAYRTSDGKTPPYQKNLYGQGDDAYELVPTLATLAALFRSQRYAITSKYPRHKLADDGTRFGAGQAIVTPKIIKAELIAQYRFDEFLGRVEKRGRRSDGPYRGTQSPAGPGRIGVLYPPDLISPVARVQCSCAVPVAVQSWR